MADKKRYYLIGIMSGTSLDGLDVSFATYNLENGRWSCHLSASKTYNYKPELAQRIQNAPKSTALELTRLDRDLGDFIGEKINTFIEEKNIDRQKIHAIASHGHTVFHQPEERLTLQIGCGTSISTTSSLPVINNFRLKDVRLNGQGAPLVPIGNRLLFDNENRIYLNIGGFANLSYYTKNKQLGYDLCPVNFVLNALCQKLELPYDLNGDIARSHEIDLPLLEKLNALSRYQILDKKALGSEWVEAKVMPLLETDKSSIKQKIATYTEHAAQQIVNYLHEIKVNEVELSGGGTHNSFLVDRIANHFNGTVILPEKEIIDFKEALIFGFLGALYLDKQHNCLKEITQADRDSIGGILHLPE